MLCDPVLSHLIVGWIPEVQTSTGRWIVLDDPSDHQEGSGFGVSAVSPEVRWGSEFCHTFFSYLYNPIVTDFD